MQVEKTKKVAAIANQFIQHARYKLTPREQKLILYMATLLRPEDSDFETYLVPVSEIEYILKSDETKKHGSFYERLDDLLDSITDKKITFPTDFTVDGHRLRGHINWVAGAVPKYDENGILCVEFGFSPQMKPFLLGLKERFTRFEFLEVAKMKSGFSIRIYQMCKAYYFENIRHGRNVFAASIKEFKSRLGISDKYPDFRNFRRKVLDVAREEINEKTHLRIDYDFIKKGRNITDLRIVINEKTDFNPESETVEAPVETVKKKVTKPANDLQSRIESLTEAQRRAFNTLTEYGVSMVFALDEVLPIIKGSELLGYEDYFVLFMLAFFEKKTNVKGQKEKVKAFGGWVVNRRFEEPNLYTQLLEQVVSRKKSLKDDERANRERAKHITAADFRQLLEEEKSIGKTLEPAFSVQKKAANQASRMSRVGEGADLFTPTSKSETVAKEKAIFNFETFKKEHADVYKRIHKERKEAFENFITASNYKQLLENSVQAYCEQWFKAQ